MTSRDIHAGQAQHTAGLRADVLRGMKLSLPLVIGYIPVAFAFGVLGQVYGLPAWATLAMSLFVYGGASQFAALPLLAAGGLVSIALTTFIINLRHLLLAASITPKLDELSPSQRLLFNAELTDEAFAIHDAEYRKRTHRSSGELFAANGLTHFSWVVGTGLGIGFGSVVPGLEELNLDFALTAMFIGILFIDVVKTRHDLLVAMVGGITAVLMTLWGAAIWATVVAAVIAATLGWLLKLRSTAGHQ